MALSFCLICPRIALAVAVMAVVSALRSLLNVCQLDAVNCRLDVIVKTNENPREHGNSVSEAVHIELSTRRPLVLLRETKRTSFDVPKM